MNFKKTKGGGDDKGCIVTIKNTYPAKDDYKAYCRSVITDIVKTMGADNLEVYIYDDNEACKLSELRLGAEFKGVGNNEMARLGQHLVAVYHRNMGYREDGHTLYFYWEANNRYTENESFEP